MKTLKLFFVFGFFVIYVNAFSKNDDPPHPDTLNEFKEKCIANAPIMESIIDSDVPIATKKERVYNWLTTNLMTIQDDGFIDYYTIEPTTIDNRIVVKVFNTIRHPIICEVSGKLEESFYSQYCYLSYTLIVDLKETKYRMRFEQSYYTINTYVPSRSGAFGSYTPAHWLMGEEWRSSPKQLDQKIFEMSFEKYNKYYNEPEYLKQYAKRKNIRERVVLSAYCDYYNALREYNAVSTLFNKVYRGIISSVEQDLNQPSVADDLDF